MSFSCRNNREPPSVRTSHVCEMWVRPHLVWKLAMCVWDVSTSQPSVKLVMWAGCEYVPTYSVKLVMCVRCEYIPTYSVKTSHVCGMWVRPHL